MAWTSLVMIANEDHEDVNKVWMLGENAIKKMDEYTFKKMDE